MEATPPLMSVLDANAMIATNHHEFDPLVSLGVCTLRFIR
jgi:hypothetical protein